MTVAGSFQWAMKTMGLKRGRKGGCKMAQKIHCFIEDHNTVDNG